RAQELMNLPGTSTAANVAAQIRRVERQLALAPRLIAVLNGDRPKDAGEALELARLCVDRDRPAAAVKLYAEALAGDTEPPEARKPDPIRVEAARAAALAGTGRGQDALPPDDAARVELRSRALTYLRQERAAWARMLDPGDRASSRRARDALT